MDGRLHRDGSVPVGLRSITNPQDIVVPDLWKHSATAGRSWECIETAAGKRLIAGDGVSASVVNMHSSGGDGCYGSWLFESMHPATETTYMCFGLELGEAITTSNTGYCIALNDTQVILARVTPGGVVAVSTATPVGLAVDTLYQFWVTRTGAGSFDVWIKGGVFTAWTQVVTAAVDATYTTGGYTACVANTAGYFGDVVHYDAVMTPAEAFAIGILDS